jgi:hypothetical protein
MLSLGDTPPTQPCKKRATDCGDMEGDIHPSIASTAARSRAGAWMGT